MSCPELQYHRQEAIGSEVIERYDQASITGKAGVIKKTALCSNSIILSLTQSTRSIVCRSAYGCKEIILVFLLPYLAPVFSYASVAVHASEQPESAQTHEGK